MMKILTGLLFCSMAAFTGAKAQQTPLPAKPEGVRPLLIGNMLPSATVSDPGGKQQDIRHATGNKKTVLVFYRGGWCPYCNKHLSELAMIEKDLVALGYQVVAVSPDKPENLRGTETKVKAGYRLYSDSHGELIRAMGIAYQAPANYINVIKEASGGVNQEMLPVPSVFLLDAKGTILFSYVNPDFRQRVNGELLLAAAKALH
jgi:peroxiredoxin